MKKIVAAILLAGVSVSAQALEVRPLVSTFPNEHKAGTMTVSNTDDVEKSYQITAEAWTVVNGKKERNPTKDLLFRPSVITLAPKASQVVRYVRTPAVGGNETAYRIKVAEIPSKIQPTKTGVVYAMGMDFPWIWRSNEAQPNLSLTWQGEELVVKNTGSATAQLVNLSAGTIQRKGLLGYVLPGETVSFKIGASKSSTVNVMLNGLPVDLDVK